MTRPLGAALVVLLIVALLVREAINVGFVSASASRRRALDRCVVVLGIGFAAVVAVHLLAL